MHLTDPNSSQGNCFFLDLFLGASFLSFGIHTYAWGSRVLFSLYYLCVEWHINTISLKMCWSIRFTCLLLTADQPSSLYLQWYSKSQGNGLFWWRPWAHPSRQHRMQWHGGHPGAMCQAWHSNSQLLAQWGCWCDLWLCGREGPSYQENRWHAHFFYTENWRSSCRISTCFYAFSL